MRGAASFHVSSILLLGAIALSEPVGAVNLIQNTDFETGSLTPWSLDSNFSGTNWQIATDTVHSGSFSAKTLANSIIQQSFAPTPTASITEVSFWIKQDPGALFSVDLLYEDGTDTFFFDTPTVTDFVRYDLTSLLDSGKSLTTLQLFGYDSGLTGPTWLDDVTVQAVPEPSSVAFLGLGLVALLRRRRTV